MVEYVERFHPQLQNAAATEIDVAHDGHMRRGQPRSSQDVAPRIPVGECVGARERGGIEPLLHGPGAVIRILPGHEIRSIRLRASIGNIDPDSRVPREAAGLVHDHADLPIAQNRSRDSRLRPLLARPKRKLVEDRRGEPMPDIED